MLPHGNEHPQALPKPPAPLISADQGVASDDIGHRTLRPRCPEYLQGLLGLLALLTSADQGAASDDPARSHLASKAFCKMTLSDFLTYV